MKTAKKALLLTVCALVLVAATIMGTMAYLTDQTQVVNNVFTAGKVDIDLDEADVDLYGEPTDQPRDKHNEYKLIPGHTYTKDPTIHVQTGSEECWLYVHITNGIADIEAAETIADQMTRLGWVKVESASSRRGDFYYYSKTVTPETASNVEGRPAGDIVVFEQFKVDGHADVSKKESNMETGANMIDVMGYAVQADGFDDPVVAAREAGFIK